MEFNISPEITEKLQAYWSNPYGMAASYFVWLGIAAFIVLMMTRYKMSLLNAILSLIGIEPMPKKDHWFNRLGIALAVVLMTLMALSWHSVNS